MKREFLVVYDYGQGGVWAYALADSREQMKELFPELDIVDEKPAWLTPERDATIRRNRTIDINERESGFLADIVRARER